MSPISRLKGKFVKGYLAARVGNVRNKRGSLSEPVLTDRNSTTHFDDERIRTPSTSNPIKDVVNIEQSWKRGRRIVDIDYLAKQMVCTDCGSQLALKDIVHEVRYGLGSVFMIECTCGIVNEVRSGKTHRVGKKGPPVFDVNTKAALGNQHPLLVSNRESQGVK